MSRRSPKVDVDSVINLADSNTLDMNLGMVVIDDDPDEIMIRVGDKTYNGLPVSPDLFPLYIGTDMYNGHLLFTVDEITLSIAKVQKGDDAKGPVSGVSQDSYGDTVRMAVDGIDRENGVLVVMYLVGMLRKT